MRVLSFCLSAGGSCCLEEYGDKESMVFISYLLSRWVPSSLPLLWHSLSCKSGNHSGFEPCSSFDCISKHTIQITSSPIKKNYHIKCPWSNTRRENSPQAEMGPEILVWRRLRESVSMDKIAGVHPLFVRSIGVAACLVMPQQALE